MENENVVSRPKSEDRQEKKSAKRVFLKKVDAETARLIASLKEKANKKPFGRKIRESEIVNAAIKLVGPEHILALQESTYTERDRLNMAHDQYQKRNGKISLDAFVGKLLRGEIVLHREKDFLVSRSSDSESAFP